MPNEALIIAAANQVVAGIVQAFPSNATLVDVFSAFEGRKGLLLVEKKGADQFQVHPTDARYHVMAKAFADAIRGH